MQFLNLKSLIANVEDEILSEVNEQQVSEQPDSPSCLRSLSMDDAINARFRKNLSTGSDNGSQVKGLGYRV